MDEAQRQELLEAIANSTKHDTTSPELARKVLISRGLLAKSGKLPKRYRQPEQEKTPMTDEATRLLPWFLHTNWCDDRRGCPNYHDLYGNDEDCSDIRQRVLEFFGIEERHVVDEWENCCDDDADFSIDIQKLDEPEFLKSESGWHYAGAWDTEDGEFVRLYVRLTTLQPTGRTDSEIVAAMNLPPSVGWQVHVIGPDDIHKCSSYDEAIQEARGINEISAKFNAEHPGNEILCLAYVRPIWIDGAMDSAKGGE